MPSKERFEEIDLIADVVLADFPSIPKALVHASISAETSYDSKQYYRHEPAYWLDYMSENKAFWTALYEFQYKPEGEVAIEMVSKAYAASYGIMQTMYDIAIAIHLKFSGFPKIGALIQDFNEGTLVFEDYFAELELPHEINESDEIGVWYGCSEMVEKMAAVWAKITAFTDKGYIVPTIDEFMAKTSTLKIGGKVLERLDFCKFVISAYQAGVGTQNKLFSILKASNQPFTWDNASEVIPQIRNEKITRYMRNHIKNAFPDSIADQLK